ncbi:uncharacterized protein LOC119268125 isoform X2 [Triticum dicoccoides]|uniref:uncharacterized protein LOC119268125 isoform X2 n=1 Tax=Triticum dicoccoides TaxID=85692 RepID=UPI00188DFCA0|nr:uncharacterized protein LOC119268125 isoform X2 [Triticum dicoccoides]XP_044340141.1 uncharacterized protein LOC123061219 isoform X2 [Triticum aestivum]
MFVVLHPSSRSRSFAASPASSSSISARAPDDRQVVDALDLKAGCAAPSAYVFPRQRPRPASSCSFPSPPQLRSGRKRRTGNMEKDAVLVCMVLGFLGSVAVTLGFVANNYSSKYNGTNCVYRSPPATDLGILGVFLVFINQVILAAYASGWCLCMCCCCPCWTKRRRLVPTPSKWNPHKELCEPSWMGLMLDL